MATIYKLRLIDAPWKYDNEQQNDPKRGGIQYPTLSMKDLAEIPIGKAFDKDSVIVVWTTFPKLMDFYYEKYNPITVINAWGFRPVTALFVWVKLNRNARVINQGANPYWEEDKNDANEYEHIRTADFYSGLGRYSNSNAEIAIVARKGKGLPRLAKNVKQLIFSPIRAHSEKPPEQYDRLQKLYGDVPRVEIFARKQNPPPNGWDAVGLDWEPKVDIRDWIKQYV